MAEQLIKFHKDTPPRFRTTKRDKVPATGKDSMELTKPKTPKLTAKGRSRPVYVESAMEKEEKEVKEIERYNIYSMYIHLQAIVWFSSDLGINHCTPV